MYENRSETTQRALSKLSKLIKKHIPSDNTVEKQCKFLWSMREIDDSIIIKSIEEYIHAGHYLSCKGYNYLKAIIVNKGKNNEQQMENEKKRYGIAPPKRRLK